MCILIDDSTRVVILGITGRFGTFSAHDLPRAGTQLVAGVSPTRPGGAVDGVPVFATVEQAVRETGANAALVYVPAATGLDAVLEAIDAGCRVIACPADGLPVADAMEMRVAANDRGAVVVGPNSPGLISPGKAKLGFMPNDCYAPGSIGLISRSGSLSYEAAYRLTQAGLGQTTCVGIGGDPVKGITAAETLRLFHADVETRAIVYLGEIGGTDEYDVAAYARSPGAKPVAALLVGRTAPPGRKMGHAAAMIGSAADGWDAKVRALEAAGIAVARSPDRLADAARAALARAT